MFIGDTCVREIVRGLPLSPPFFHNSRFHTRTAAPRVQRHPNFLSSPLPVDIASIDKIQPDFLVLHLRTSPSSKQPLNSNPEDLHCSVLELQLKSLSNAPKSEPQPTENAFRAIYYTTTKMKMKISKSQTARQSHSLQCFLLVITGSFVCQSHAFSTKPLLLRQRIFPTQNNIWNTRTVSRATTITLKKPSQQHHMTNSEKDDETIADGTNKMMEGFGVGQKVRGLRDLVESDDEIDLCVSEDDLVVPPKDEEKVDECPVESTKTTPTLSPMAILRFIAPTLALWIAPPVMSLIDTSVVGRFCGANDLAALNPGCTLIDSSAYLFMFIATAATNMVASARAEGDAAKSERVIGEALFLALCSGTLLASIVLAAGRPLLLGIAGQESAAVVPSALKYATVRAFGQPFVVMASVARAASLASKDTRGPLLSVAMAFILNAVGTVALVRGTSLGILGAAIGTLCADIAATVFLLARLRMSRRKRTTQDVTLSNGESPSKTAAPLLVIPTLSNLRYFLQYAAPIFFTILGKSVVYNGIAVSVGRMGSVALAAHQVLLRNFFFWTPVGDSVGMTSQVFLPGILAEERKTGVPKRGAKRLLFSIGVLAGIFAGTLAGLLPSKGAALFTTSSEVAAALSKTAPILALSVTMHAIALTCEGMLLAQRDLGFLSNSYVITTVLTAALLLSPSRPVTLGGSWFILSLFQGVRALQFALRTFWISRRRKLEAA